MEVYYSLLATYLRPLRLRLMVMAALLLGSTGLQLLCPQVLKLRSCSKRG